MTPEQHRQAATNLMTMCAREIGEGDMALEMELHPWTSDNDVEAVLKLIKDANVTISWSEVTE